jgi:release factor glutamine methyltransferase
MTITEALVQGTKRLKDAKTAAPSLDASLLLAGILHTDKAGLILHGPDTISDEDLERFHALLDRRISGEALAYILKRKEFRGLEFIVSPAVLIPRPDTETLVEAALESAAGLLNAGQCLNAAPYPNAAHVPETTNTMQPQKTIKILDLCTGSGAVAIALKNEMPLLEVWASDISAEALEVARLNADRLLPGKSIHFLQSDLFSGIDGSFDIIVSNPPYVSSAVIETLAPEVKKEPHLALDGGPDGLEIIRRLIQDSIQHFCTGSAGGRLLLEADSSQMQAISEMLGSAGFIDIVIQKDLAGLDRVIMGKTIPA